jgi:DNA repair protein RecN (Recombination protein N)
MPLRRLSLRDFVIVDALELDFKGGFTALTGETGAGKSILIDAIQLLLGQRADALVVREGTGKCELSAEFDSPSSAQAWLDEQGLEGDDDSLLLRRQIDAQGRSRAWINGHSATLSQLKALSEHVMDIHGQHAWHSLTRPAAQMQLLDAYARLDTAPLQNAWQTWRSAERVLQEAQSQQAAWQAQRERLSWQLTELEPLAPGDHEWEELNQEHTRASHAQSLIEAAHASAQALDGERGGVSAALHQAIQTLSAQSKWEPQFNTWLEVLQQAQALVTDVAHDVHSYARRSDLDSDQLQRLDERVALWMSLAKRFRCAPEDLAAQAQAWRDQLTTLEAQADTDALQAKADAARRQWQALAEAISAQRQQAGHSLGEAVSALMQDLGLSGGRFEVAVSPAEPNPLGSDQIQFLVAGHAGASARPVAKVASGGELSRIALAIAVTTSTLGSVDALIFDEVDSGIGGQVAHTVGALMRRLGQDRQVLAITHLPQVAATAHQHYKVRKQMHDGQTLSRIEPLDDNQRLEEIARMLGGSSSSASVMAHAREILGWS